MSKHSELIGSFIRTGNYPLEADYIFNSEQELIDFYNIPENKALLHKGLFKIVSSKEGQFLYWVVEESGELVFQKVSFKNEDIDDELLRLINKETEDRKQADINIYGTDDITIIPEDLNTILKLSETFSWYEE